MSYKVDRFPGVFAAVLAAFVLASCVDAAWSKDGGGGSGGGHGGEGTHDGGGTSGGDDNGGDNHGGPGRDDGLDHDFAERAVRNGELKPLAAVLRTVRTAKAGKVIGVDLAQTAGQAIVYRIVLLASGNERWQAVVDAKTNVLIDLRRY
jgi:hypothetical protein